MIRHNVSVSRAERAVETTFSVEVAMTVTVVPANVGFHDWGESVGLMSTGLTSSNRR